MGVLTECGHAGLMFVQRPIAREIIICTTQTHAAGLARPRPACEDDLESREAVCCTLRRVPRTMLIARHMRNPRDTTSRWFRCSSSLLRCRRIHHERRHEGLRGVEQWQMAPARQSHDHLTFRAAEGSHRGGAVKERANRARSFDLRASWWMSVWRRLCTCKANRGVVDSARTASSSKCNSDKPHIAMRV